MANLTGYGALTPTDTSVVDSTAQLVLGTRRVDLNGNEYVYLKGVGSTVAGSWVSYDYNYATTLLAGNAVGKVAIAMAAIVANKYGWYQIFGVNTVAATDTVSADKQLFIDGTAGRADDAVVSGDMIIGAVSATADSSNVATVVLNYPYVSDTLTA